jgi:C1A family cysteine protease
MPETTHAYGWRRQRPDDRDYQLAEHVILTDAAALPPSVDLRETGALADPIFDQGDLGSCTANAIASALQYEQRVQKLTAGVTPSRLALYYWERLIEGDTQDDAGAELRDGLKVVAGQPGYVDESLWPYDPARFAVAPTDDVAAAAAQDKATKYMAVSVNATAMKQALASDFPIVVGFDAFEAIETQTVAETGNVPMPGRHEQPIGGHAVLCVGYDDDAKRWLCRNSWGVDWGQQGYFTMPYGYLDSPAYASDFWVIQQEQEGGTPAPTPTPGPDDPLRDLAALLRQFMTGIEDWLAKHGL